MCFLSFKKTGGEPFGNRDDSHFLPLKSCHSQSENSISDTLSTKLGDITHSAQSKILMNIIKIKALNTRDYITVSLHSHHVYAYV